MCCFWRLQFIFADRRFIFADRRFIFADRQFILADYSAPLKPDYSPKDLDFELKLDISCGKMSVPQKLILKNFQSPGDLVMLTAAVRDLHRSCPGEYLTDVRSPCPALWEHNPFITAIADDDPEVRVIDCQYPLIHRSNHAPYHFIHGFSQFLGSELGKTISLTEFKGDIHISGQEKSWFSQIYELVGADIPFWIIVAGGKLDYTIKWWEQERFQAVVDHFREKIAFVQVGQKSHNHQPLKGVIDLRGQTDLRQLIRLVYHSAGVVCPVTLGMHLAAAVETKRGSSKNRPCVVIAGGREPPHWEAYPHHQFLHTVGALYCCDHGGCWKSRTVPLGDGDPKDRPGNLCVDVVKGLPRCMAMIEPSMVINAVECYLNGGVARKLTVKEWESVIPHLS